MFTVVENCNVTKKAYLLITVETIEEARRIAKNHFFPCEIVEHNANYEEYLLDFGYFTIESEVEYYEDDLWGRGEYMEVFHAEYHEGHEPLPEEIGVNFDKTYLDYDEAEKVVDRLNYLIEWYRDLFENGYAYL